jgi:SAM-dependent methyltransferase
MEGAVTSNLRKYQTSNPLVQFLIRRFFRKLVRLASDLHPKTITDLGCGEGIVAEALLKYFGPIKYVGYDKNPIAIREAERRNPTAVFQCADLFDLEAGADPVDVVLCLEVLEHVEDIDGFLRQITRLRARRWILSVPWEPFFRIGNLCRGQYLRRFGNHPEHIHCFGITSLRATLSRHFLEVRIESSFPWLFASCQPSVSRS